MNVKLLVGVTGFEPAASSSRSESSGFATLGCRPVRAGQVSVIVHAGPAEALPVVTQNVTHRVARRAEAAATPGVIIGSR